MSPLAAAVLASGSGSNFQALADHCRASGGSVGGSDGDWQIGLLLSDRESAGALDRARALGIPAGVLPPAAGADPGGGGMLDALHDAGADVVFLAGYLRLVPPAVVEAYRGRILNIHPALLPAFGGPGMYGRHVHEAVLQSGARVTGATVHLVDERYDEGRILAQWPVPVRPGDTPETLAARVLEVEHRLYPAVADDVCRRIRDGKQPAPLDFDGIRFSLDRPATDRRAGLPGLAPSAPSGAPGPTDGSNSAAAPPSPGHDAP